MQNIIDMAYANWEIILVVIGVVINIINAATKHWSEHAGLVKALLFITELLSIFRSAGTKPGRAGNLKSPLNVKTSGPLLLALCSSLLLNACASLPEKLNTLREVNKEITSLSLDYYAIACNQIANGCNVPLADCKEYKLCDQKREKIAILSKAINSAVIIGSSAVLLGRKEQAEENLQIAIAEFEKLQKMMDDIK